jgi:hypothetical protein
MKERHSEKHFYRYMDDVCILSKSKKRLHYLREDTKWYWEEKLNLIMKDNWQVFPVMTRGIDFLGYKFQHERTSLRKRIKQNMRKNINPKNAPSYNGWLNWCDCFNLKHKYSEVNYG